MTMRLATETGTEGKQNRRGKCINEVPWPKGSDKLYSKADRPVLHVEQQINLSHGSLILVYQISRPYVPFALWMAISAGRLSSGQVN
jgi:hypothetical protein